MLVYATVGFNFCSVFVKKNRAKVQVWLCFSEEKHSQTNATNCKTVCTLFRFSVLAEKNQNFKQPS
jgi:hypothetical protein